MYGVKSTTISNLQGTHGSKFQGSYGGHTRRSSQGPNNPASAGPPEDEPAIQGTRNRVPKNPNWTLVWLSYLSLSSSHSRSGQRRGGGRHLPSTPARGGQRVGPAGVTTSSTNNRTLLNKSTGGSPLSTLYHHLIIIIIIILTTM